MANTINKSVQSHILYYIEEKIRDYLSKKEFKSAQVVAAMDLNQSDKGFTRLVFVCYPLQTSDIKNYIGTKSYSGVFDFKVDIFDSNQRRLNDKVFGKFNVLDIGSEIINILHFTSLKGTREDTFIYSEGEGDECTTIVLNKTQYTGQTSGYMNENKSVDMNSITFSYKFIYNAPNTVNTRKVEGTHLEFRRVRKVFPAVPNSDGTKVSTTGTTTVIDGAVS